MSNKNSALIVIDVQNDYFDGGALPLWQSDICLTRVIEAIVQAQAAEMLVLLVQHVATQDAPLFKPGSWGVALHPAVRAAAPNAPCVIKAEADSFLHTELANILVQHGIQSLRLCGMMTQNCITHTALSPTAQQFHIEVLADACTTVSALLHHLALKALAPRVDILA